MSDLEALFDGVDGIKEDAMEFGIMGASAVGAHVAYGYLLRQPAVANIVGKVPAVAQPLIPIALGIAVARFAGKYDRRVATGAAVGLVAAGVKQLAARYAPPSIQAALAGVDEEVLMGHLGIATTVEQGDLLNQYLAGAPITMEQVNGLDASVDEVPLGGAGFGGGFSAAATLVG